MGRKLGALDGTAGTRLEIEILGGRYPAEVVGESPWDPGNAHLALEMPPGIICI